MNLTDALILLPVLLVFFGLLYRRKLAAKPQDRETVPRRGIAVDGSNVMHWGGDPSLQTVSRVVAALKGKGLAPIVFFDANVGYKVDDRYYSARDLAGVIGLPERQICVVHKGVVADEWLLDFATDHKLRIVTNDRFRDWRVQFPIAAEKGRLVHGEWRSGTVVFRNL